MECHSCWVRARFRVTPARTCQVGIVAAAVYFGRGDLKAKTEALKEASRRAQP